MGQFDSPPDPYLRDVFAALDRRLSALERVNASRTAQAAEWVPLTLGEGWTNYGDPYPEAAVYQDGLGRVYMRGVIVSSGVDPAGNPIAEMPPGFEAATVGYFACVGTDFGMSVWPAGVTVPTQRQGLYSNVVEPSGTTVHLESISYRTK